MRYIKQQKHSLTCGLVATANALKSKGYKISYEDLFKDYKNNPWKFEDILNHLHAYNINFKIIDPNFKNLETELNKERGIIVVNKLYNGKGRGHYYFLKGKPTKKYFKGFNFFCEKTKSDLIHKDLMRKDFAYSYRYWNHVRQGYPKTIVIL